MLKLAEHLRAQTAPAKSGHLSLIEGRAAASEEINPLLAGMAPAEVPYQRIKRLIDIFGAALLIAALLPVFAIVALAVKMSSRGPVLYISQRAGLMGVPFPFYKFRSMHVDAEAKKAALASQNEREGPIFKIRSDPRITPIGRFLRKYSLDELPQLFCVLFGAMSLVGPRPPILGEVRSYGEAEIVRLTVKPGLTCFWQVMGRSDLSFEKWMELDRQYVESMSLSTDFLILAKTPAAVLRGRGAY